MYATESPTTSDGVLVADLPVPLYTRTSFSYSSKRVTGAAGPRLASQVSSTSSSMPTDCLDARSVGVPGAVNCLMDTDAVAV